MEGWEARLLAVIEDARHQPYQLGVHDCFRVACQAIEALTGVERWPEFKGRYATKRDALHLIAQYGHNFEHAFSWFFGTDPVPAVWARRGDILCYQDPAGEKHLGVCIGARVAVLGEQGLAYIRPRDCLCCWPIG